MTVTGADNAVLQWNAVALQAIRDTAPPPPVAARALAVLHTAMFDAWASYDGRAVGTRLGVRLRRPEAERTPANKRAAVSHAAFRALADQFPARLADFQARMRALGYDPGNRSTDLATAAGMSGRHAGVHYRSADLEGRRLGRKVAVGVALKAWEHILGVGQQRPAPAARAPRPGVASRVVAPAPHAPAGRQVRPAVHVRPRPKPAARHAQPARKPAAARRYLSHPEPRLGTPREGTVATARTRPWSDGSQWPPMLAGFGSALVLAGTLWLRRTRRAAASVVWRAPAGRHLRR